MLKNRLRRGKLLYTRGFLENISFLETLYVIYIISCHILFKIMLLALQMKNFTAVFINVNINLTENSYEREAKEITGCTV